MGQWKQEKIPGLEIGKYHFNNKKKHTEQTAEMKSVHFACLYM